MASKIRSLIASKVIAALQDVGVPASRHVAPKSVLPLVVLNRKQDARSSFEFCLPVQSILEADIKSEKNYTSDFIYRFQTDNVVYSVSRGCREGKNPLLHFGINRDFFTKTVLHGIVQNPKDFWKKSPLLEDCGKDKVVVEYSSPNIAKPFHMGHLRSTIIGNFLANLEDALGNDVVRLNFLGDWGTQFGLLNVGLSEMGQDFKKISDPLRTLFDVYVKANAAAETDADFTPRARAAFKRLEEGRAEELEQWRFVREQTVKELQKVYDRLGVSFDEYHGESMYCAKESDTVVDELRSSGLLRVLPDGKQVVDVADNKAVALLRSDGSTLYLARDVAAALDRYAKYKFHRCYYVVDNAQTDHFAALVNVLHKMNKPFAPNIKHVKFGRIMGMSTRKGNVVFLQDVLDEAKEIMLEKQKQSKTTRKSEDILSGETADVLGITAVLINDMKQRRQRDYVFDWNKALQNVGDTGVRLQYTHCRLKSLEKNCGVELNPTCSVMSLEGIEAAALVRDISQFDEVLKQCHNELEPCVMVVYLFRLCNSINSAFKVLPVKGKPSNVAEARLLLFHAARLTLNAGLKILGVKPLDEM